VEKRGEATAHLETALIDTGIRDENFYLDKKGKGARFDLSDTQRGEYGSGEKGSVGKEEKELDSSMCPEGVRGLGPREKRGEEERL